MIVITFEKGEKSMGNFFNPALLLLTAYTQQSRSDQFAVCLEFLH